MGIGPVGASRLALERAGLQLSDMDLIELNEAFAAQALACTRTLGLDDFDPRLNPQGGAIALGHPLGMTGARLLLTASKQLVRANNRYALVTLCIGVGQGTRWYWKICSAKQSMIQSFKNMVPVVDPSAYVIPWPWSSVT